MSTGGKGQERGIVVVYRQEVRETTLSFLYPLFMQRRVPPVWENSSFSF